MKQEENKYSRIQYFLWLVAGSEISVLKKCPNDYNRHANIGLMIIITSLFAGMTAFVAGSTFAKENVIINGKVIEQVNTLGVTIFAFIWAFLIFSLDRSMVNSIKKDPTETEKSIWGYFAPRLVLAIILSFFMSIPIEHIVFKEKIAFQMNENNKNNWLKRQDELNRGYDTKKTESALKRDSAEAAGLGKELDKECSLCPKVEYKRVISEANEIGINKIPPLKSRLEPLESEIDRDFNKLWNEQTSTYNRTKPESLHVKLIPVRLVRWDEPLKEKIRIKQGLKSEIERFNNEMGGLRTKASEICEAWKNEIQAKKNEVDSLNTINKKRLLADNDSIRIQSNKYKSDIESMQGFDTQFVTLFLMPDAGVQVLKWLIFLALLVIEILPTYLKLKTPIGQYDREMQQAEDDTRDELKKRSLKYQATLEEIEEYRKNKEIVMNKNLIDKVVSIEERLANEMLVEWEVKARTQMKNNVEKS
jgi:hypothetical protein